MNVFADVRVAYISRTRIVVIAIRVDSAACTTGDRHEHAAAVRTQFLRAPIVVVAVRGALATTVDRNPGANAA